MAYLLALASAGFYGGADFLGGLASRRISTFVVVFVSQLVGMLLLALLLSVLPAGSRSWPDLAWGGAAGLAGGAGVALLYRALAIGTMAMVAPITAVCGVALPVLAGVVFGERPGPLTAWGILLALVAIVLVTQNGQPTAARTGGAVRSGSGVGLALLSGVAIGFFYLALANTTAEAGLWPLVAARAISVPLFGALTVVTGQTLRMNASVARLVLAAGAMDMLANALYLLATHNGPLAVVVTLASLYPASTVILARVVLAERLSGVQIAGVVCALIAVTLIVGTS